MMNKKVIIIIIILLIGTTILPNVATININKQSPRNNFSNEPPCVLDQYQDQCQGNTHITGPESEWQEFTPSMSKLVKIELKIMLEQGNNDTGLRINLKKDSIMGDTLKTWYLDINDIPTNPEWVELWTDNYIAIELIVGDTYVIEVNPEYNNEIVWYFADGNLYHNGSSSIGEAYDFSFKTYIMPSGEHYAIWYDWGGTWSDAEKTDDNEEDDKLCWAASASNILHWTNWGNVVGISDEDEIFQHFQDHWKDEGDIVKYGWIWWFNGTNFSDVDVPGGGNFWPSADFNDYFLHEIQNRFVLREMRDFMLNGHGTTLSLLELDGTGPHSITCWGYGYDPNYNATQYWDYFLGLWITDSDDDKSYNSSDPPPDSLKYVEVEYNWTYSRWQLNNYLNKDRYISEVYGLEIKPTLCLLHVENPFLYKPWITPKSILHILFDKEIYQIHFRISGPPNSKFNMNEEFYKCDGSWITGLNNKPIKFQIIDEKNLAPAGKYIVEYYVEDGAGSSELQVEEFYMIDLFEKPKSNRIYLFDKLDVNFPLVVNPIIIGSLTLKACLPKELISPNIWIDFIINGEIIHSDYTIPFEWFWNDRGFGKYTIKLVAHDEFENIGMMKKDVIKIL